MLVKKNAISKILLIGLSIVLLSMFMVSHTEKTALIKNDTAFAQVNDYPPPPIAPQSNYYLGAFYMPQPNQLTGNWHSLILYNRESGNFRKPLLGYAPGNNVTAMDHEIKWAVENGLNYFVFNDFWASGQSTPVYPQSVNAFMQAEYSEYMDFAVMVSRITAPENAETNLAREKFVTEVAAYYRNVYFRQPNYLHIDGKPAVYIYQTNHSFGIGHHLYPDIAEVLKEFETAVGQDVYWVYVIPAYSQQFFDFYKRMGFDMVAPYYVAAGITVNPDPTSILNHRDFVEQSYGYDQELQTYAENVGLKYVHSPTLNFDISNIYLSYWWFVTDRTLHTQNPDIANFAWLLNQTKADLDVSESPADTYIDDKAMLNIGAWNEYSEGSALAPSYGELNPDDPFSITNLVRDTFTTPSGDEYPENYLPTQEFTPEVSPQSQWNLAQVEDLEYFDTYYTSTNLNPVARTTYAEAQVQQSIFLMINAATNINTADSNTIRVEFGALCDETNRVADCIRRVEIISFTTNCAGDTIETCTNPDKPNNYGRAALNITNCRQTNEATWATCDIKMTDGGNWQDRLDMMYIVFYLTKFAQENNPVTVQVQSLRLLETSEIPPISTHPGLPDIEEIED